MGAPSNATQQSITFQPFGFDLTGLADAPQPITLTTRRDERRRPVDRVRQQERSLRRCRSTTPHRRAAPSTARSSGRDGTIVVPATNIAQSPSQSRDPSLLALGDRVLFVYADDRDQNSGYELYAHTLAADLSTSSRRQPRHASDGRQRRAASSSFAVDGTVLVLFRDDRGPKPAVFETALKCTLPTP